MAGIKTNVLLLADVLEAFRDRCLKNYKLDPAHFYTAPGLAWQALLKTAAEYCEHEKGVKNVSYALTSLGLGCLQTLTYCGCLKKVFEVGLLKHSSAMLEHISSVRRYKQRVWMGND